MRFKKNKIDWEYFRRHRSLNYGRLSFLTYMSKYYFDFRQWICHWLYFDESYACWMWFTKSKQHIRHTGGQPNHRLRLETSCTSATWIRSKENIASCLLKEIRTTFVDLTNLDFNSHLNCYKLPSLHEGWRDGRRGGGGGGGGFFWGALFVNYKKNPLFSPHF